MQATTPEDNSFFPKRKRRAASGGTRTRDVHVHSLRPMLLETPWYSGTGDLETWRSGLWPFERLWSNSETRQGR